MGLFGFLKKKDKSEYEHIYDNGDDSGIDYSDLSGYESDEAEEYAIDAYEDIYDDPSFEDVYDPDGNEVHCDMCYGIMGRKDGKYVCRECGRTMEREYFLNYIGAEG